MLDNYAALESSGETAIGLFNAETGRNFAVLMTPGFRFDDVQREKLLAAELESALETIKILQEDNALLDIIDAQNDVLMGRCEPYQERGKAEAEYYGASPTLEEALRWSRTGNDVAEGPEPGWPTDGVCGADDCPCNTTEASSPNFVAETTIKEHFTVEHVSVTLQEYEELLNLRKKRANNHEQLSAMDAKLKEKKKAIRTLEDSRDHWKASYYDLEDKYLLTPNMPDIESPTLADPDGVTRWIR